MKQRNQRFQCPANVLNRLNKLTSIFGYEYSNHIFVNSKQK